MNMSYSSKDVKGTGMHKTEGKYRGMNHDQCKELRSPRGEHVGS